MKKIFAILLAFVMTFSITAFAEDDIKVLIDNEQINFDVPPQRLTFSGLNRETGFQTSLQRQT